MKKLLVSLFVVMMLVGCGGNSGKKAQKAETKTCTSTMAGMTISYKFDAVDDIIEVITVLMELPAAITQNQDLSKLTDADLKRAGEVALSSLGVKEGKGVTAKYTVKDKKLNGSITIDVKNGDTTILKNLGFKVDSKKMKLSDSIKMIEKNDTKCK